MKHVSGEVRLDWQTLREELLVEVLAGLLAHEDASALLILSWSAGASHHLKDVHDGIIDVSMLFTLVELYTHDDHHVASNR